MFEMYKYKLKIKHPLCWKTAVKEKNAITTVDMHVYINHIHAIITIHTEDIKFNSDS